MKICIFWHRRDLRIHDNAGLAAALASGLPVVPLFIYDSDILDCLPDKADARLTFIYDEVERLARQTQAAGGTFLARYGKPVKVLEQLVKEFDVAAVHTNEDYEPYATRRDGEVGEMLGRHSVDFYLYKDQVIFAKNEIMTKSGTVPKVFGAYHKAYLDRLTDDMLLPYGSADAFTKTNLAALAADKAGPRPTLESMGFVRKEQYVPTADLPAEAVVRNYHKTRNTPALQNGSTRISVQLRFGTLSVRQVVRQARALNPKLLAEISWRDFFMMLLWHFPFTATEAYDPKMRHIPYRNNEKEFRAWCEGRTGYPLVDAGMRELNATGYLPNRVRIATAGFLVKHLFIDWRWGEKYFADKLLDYELANNVGNWQWMAGTGAVAAPWFRVYSPQSQLEKVDPELEYVKRWVPELGTPAYPAPIFEHKFARERAVEAIRTARNAAS
ncbi:cryptochrome/photolyase family protein [Hymenobacter properus]|uniref:Deoxyribodipyrimidine photo-lyase n=1 Tax=Hymenobacter properus TaxID=2791026 RepID=A0A931BAZ2_9BACT|nr:deoxyribodipyrimidine photo-lyase [Hymenobacter properus]MBF9140424.1 deoxyribodipyrimidine photo-lyase [Hymenobacter properus]MBR7719231.1 deoxyribodipyrimidine photo-lyase [Microvirga sp. SRT04]